MAIYVKDPNTGKYYEILWGFLQDFVDYENLFNNKLSCLYDITFIRDIEQKYGYNKLKEAILQKLKIIDDFDDCIIITDFTKFQEDGRGASLPGSGDDYSISKTEDEVIISITSDGTSGWRTVWLYKSFPQQITSAFVTYMLKAEDSSDIAICETAPTSDYGAVNKIAPNLNPNRSQKDFSIWKTIDGTSYELATEAVDLNAVTYYKIAFYWKAGEGAKAWRDSDPIDVSSPKLTTDDYAINSAEAFSIKLAMALTNTTKKAYFRVPVIVAYKY